MTKLNDSVNQYLGQRSPDDSMHTLRNEVSELSIHLINGEAGPEFHCAGKRPSEDYVARMTMNMIFGLPTPEVETVRLNPQGYGVETKSIIQDHVLGVSFDASYDAGGQLTQVKFAVSSPNGSYEEVGEVQKDGSIDFGPEGVMTVDSGLPNFQVDVNEDEVRANFIALDDVSLHSYTVPRQAETVEDKLAQLLAEFQ
jgi:hypothetical protein